MLLKAYTLTFNQDKYFYSNGYNVIYIKGKLTEYPVGEKTFKASTHLIKYHP